MLSNQRDCLGCGAAFAPVTQGQKCCGLKCRRRYNHGEGVVVPEGRARLRCPSCRQLFFQGRPMQKFCSGKCSQFMRSAAAVGRRGECAGCGRQFIIPPGGQRFCSVDCQRGRQHGVLADPLPLGTARFDISPAQRRRIEALLSASGVLDRRCDRCGGNLLFEREQRGFRVACMACGAEASTIGLPPRVGKLLEMLA